MKNKQWFYLNWKDGFSLICPNCGEEILDIVSLDDDSITCQNCEKEIEIKFQVTDIRIVER